MRSKIEFIHDHRTSRLKAQPITTTAAPAVPLSTCSYDSTTTSAVGSEAGTLPCDRQVTAPPAVTAQATAVPAATTLQHTAPITNRINTTTYAVKQARVKQKRDPLLVELDDLCEKFTDLKTTEVKQLGQFNKLNAQFKELIEKAQRTLQKAKTLCEDAMVTDMEQDATALDAQSTMLETEISSVESFVESLRTRFGVPISGLSFNQR